MRPLRRDSSTSGEPAPKQIAVYVQKDAHNDERVLLVNSDPLGEEIVALAKKRLEEAGLKFSVRQIRVSESAVKRTSPAAV